MGELSIWNKLRAKGFSEKATAAIMGNMEAESAFRSNNVEDRYHSGTWKSDDYYTAQVDNGNYSRDDFMYDNGSRYGYGLCQWTYPTRKAALYDFAKSRGVSIADEQMQIDFLVKELNDDYPNLMKVLKSDASLAEMTEKYLKVFENPDDKSASAVNYRIRLAQEIYNKYAGQESTDTVTKPSPTPTQKPVYANCKIEVRVLTIGDYGRDVGMAQWAMVDLGYDLGKSGPNKDGVDGDFGDFTEEAVNSIKGSIGLPMDGAIDEDVWQFLYQ